MGRGLRIISSLPCQADREENLSRVFWVDGVRDGREGRKEERMPPRGKEGGGRLRGEDAGVAVNTGIFDPASRYSIIDNFAANGMAASGFTPGAVVGEACAARAHWR